MKLLFQIILMASLGMLAACAPQKPWEDHQLNPYLAPPRPVVVMETTEGIITLELYNMKSPKTVENFLGYVNDGFYDGTIFHRVMEDFIIQGGGHTLDMELKEVGEPVESEADNEVRNLRGSIGAARTSDPDSATSQFYINLANNYGMDQREGNPGYTVFGRVLTGMNIVDRIGNIPTHTVGNYQNVPVEPVIILRAYQQ